jgi:hypothetical protein
LIPPVPALGLKQSQQQNCTKKKQIPCINMVTKKSKSVQLSSAVSVSFWSNEIIRITCAVLGTGSSAGSTVEQVSSTGLICIALPSPTRCLSSCWNKKLFTNPLLFKNLLVNCWKKCVNVFVICSWRIKNIICHTFRNIYLYCNNFSVKDIICHWRLSVKLYKVSKRRQLTQIVGWG